jgi:hypothetical protein
MNFIDFTNEKNDKTLNDEYNLTTTEKYRVKRILEIDALTDQEIKQNNMTFKYYNKWNPYNGEITGIDEIGPLCFNALTLYNYYLKNCLNGLWMQPDLFYEGTYGEYLGCGKTFSLLSRNESPEKYIFRIPIIDCYILKIYENKNIITYGPELTEDDINAIDILIEPKIKMPLKTIKYYYDMALSENPDYIVNAKCNHYNKNMTQKENMNKYYVDQLFKIVHGYENKSVALKGSGTSL